VLPFPSEPNFPDPDLTWNEVARLCRRVCVLRAQGRLDEAGNLHTQSIGPLIAALQAGREPTVSVEERLAATMAAESRRVADAALLAELLAPMLGVRAGITTPASPVVGTAAALPDVRDFAPPSTPARPVASIADFLDEMLAQETPQASPRNASERRAS
jgi:hypothetical protein